MTLNLAEVFVGCSSEGIDAAKAIQNNLKDVAIVTSWTQGFFDLTQSTLQSILNKADQFDFAVFLLLPDDTTNSRGTEKSSPRDNTIFEAGIFLGVLGQNRVFFVRRNDVEIKVLSDLAGITLASFNRPPNRNWDAALGPATNQIESVIKRIGNRSRQASQPAARLKKAAGDEEVSLAPPSSLSKGMSAADLMVGLVEANEMIQSVILVVYKIQPPLDERLPGSAQPDPNALLNDNSFQELLRQDQAYDREIVIERPELTKEFLQTTFKKLDSDFAVAVSSTMKLQDGSSRHLAMMDFRCRPTPENARQIKTGLTRLGQPNGILLNSGRSFHFYGLKPLNDDGLRVFFAKCLLLTNLVDARYIAHRLKDGNCRLRISPTQMNRSEPNVVEYF